MEIRYWLKIKNEQDLKLKFYQTDTMTIKIIEIDVEIQPKDEEVSIYSILKKLEKQLSYFHLGTIGDDSKLRSEDLNSVLISKIQKLLALEKEFFVQITETSENSNIQNEISSILNEKRSKKVEENALELKEIQETFKTSSQLFFNVLKQNKGDCIGKRRDNSFEYTQYDEFLIRIQKFSFGIRELAQKGDFISICAKNCIEWFISDISCLFSSLISVPIHTDFSIEQINSILTSTKSRIVICDSHTSSKFRMIQDKYKTDFIIIKIGSNDKYSFQNVEDMGSKVIKDDFVLSREPKDIVTLIYTSGTTSEPKGAIFTEEKWYLMLKNIKGSGYKEYCTVSFLPTAHMTDRMKYIRTLMIGGQIAISSPENIIKDLPLICPTTFVAPPRVWNFIYSQFNEELNGNNQKELKEKYKKIFGHRLRTMVTGGSKNSSKIKEFFEDLLSIPMYDTYGTTETSGILQNGFPVKEVELKLVSVPEMGYLTSDIPYPRGELYVKSNMNIERYFNQDVNPLDDGYYKTGDIVQKYPNGSYEIIDRKKHLFKLSNSEWISPEKLEIGYSTSEMIKQIFITPNETSNYLIAVIVPNKVNIQEKELMNELIKIAKNNEFLNYEIPKGIIIEKEEFSQENELLTISLKYSRPNLNKKYKKLIKEKGNEIDEIKDNLKKELFGSVSNILPNTKDLNLLLLNFKEIGGDSLLAVKIVNLINEKFNIKISTHTIFEGNFVDNILNAINNEQNIIKEEVPILPESLIPIKEKDGDNGSIFLTGVSGFLGEFILKELLNQIKSKTVYCLIRETSRSNQFIKSINNDRVKFIYGDLGKPKLGVKEDEYEYLSKNVSVIYHNGALTNHILPYSELKKVNVDGTIEIIKLSCTYRNKIIHYISSTSIYSGLNVYPIDIDLSKYIGKSKGGYSKSKFYSELMIQKARERGFKCCIYRPGMISFCSKTGKGNDEDWIFRLFKTVKNFGIIPTQEGVLEMCPVDYVAELIVYCSIHFKKDFNILHPNIGIEWCEIIKNMNVKTCEYKDWFEIIKKDSSKENLIFSLSTLFEKGIPLRKEINQIENNSTEILNAPKLDQDYLNLIQRNFN